MAIEVKRQDAGALTVNSQPPRTDDRHVIKETAAAFSETVQVRLLTLISPNESYEV